VKPKPDINRLAELAEVVKSSIVPVFGEATDAINEAINAAVEEQQEKGSDAPLRVTLSIRVVWDTSGDTVDISLPVPVKRTFTANRKMPDHKQTNLPLDGDVSGEDANPKPWDRYREDKTRKLAAKVLSLPEVNPELHNAAVTRAAARGIEYVDALMEIAKESGGGQ
jgi:hypothetical protein